VGLKPKTGVASATKGAAYYNRKFNYDPESVDRVLDKLNTVELCYRSRYHCGVDRPPPPDIKCGSGVDHYYWPSHLWVRVKESGGTTVRYRCGVRREHTGMPGVTTSMIAATARWRWLLKDETVWDYCSAMGCCETAGVGFGW
jgi:hypothetical protein